MNNETALGILVGFVVAKQLLKTKPATIGKVYPSRRGNTLACNDDFWTDSRGRGACSYHKGLRNQQPTRQKHQPTERKELKVYSKEWYELVQTFERAIKANPRFGNPRLDKEKSGEVPNGYFYQSGNANALFHAFLLGYNAGVAAYMPGKTRELKYGSKEWFEVVKNFESASQKSRFLPNMRYDKVGKNEKVPPGVFYQNGETNQIFHAFLLGYSEGTLFG